MMTPEDEIYFRPVKVERPPAPPSRRELTAQLAAATKRAEEAERELYMPGVSTCDKCKFVGQRCVLVLSTGESGVAKDWHPETCPNGCGMQRRMTWQEGYASAHKFWEEQVTRAVEAERERDAALAVLRDVQWSSNAGYNGSCPCCYNEEAANHRANCALAAALKGAAQ